MRSAAYKNVKRGPKTVPHMRAEISRKAAPRRTPQAGTGGLFMPRPKFFRGEKLRPRKGLGKGGEKLH
mgnify:FL=1